MPKPMQITAASFLVLACTASGLAAQDFTYTTRTSAEFGGPLGRIVNLMPGGADPIEETTRMTGSMVRTDREGSSTIANVETFEFTHLDHEARTYFTLDYGNLAEMWSQPDMFTADERRDAQRAAEQDAEYNYDISFSVDRTGDRERFLGYEAERIFYTIEIEATEDAARAEDPENPQSGTLVYLVEVWLSPDFPVYRAMQERALERRKGAKPNGSDAAFDYDPRIQAAMERYEEEMQGVEGYAMKTVTHVVAVPQELEFDREAVLRDADRSLVADVADAVASSAVQSARRRIGGIAGRLGRGRREEPEQPEPEQVVIMRSIVEVLDFSEGPLDPAIFVIPEDYTERTFGR